MHRGLPFLLCLLAVACGPRELHVTLAADNNSGQAGTAILTERGAGMTVVLKTSAPLNADGGQNAHIHPGICGELEPPRIPLTQMAVLPDDPESWGSTTQVTGFGFKDLATGDWAINIHDAREPSVYVSCGEVPRP